VPENNMELNYILTTEDYLEMQLYNMSQDEKYKKRRSLDRFRLPGLSLLFGLILLFDDLNSILAYVFIASAVLFFIFYSQWSAWFYKRMCRRQVSENTKDYSPYDVKLLLGSDVIEVVTPRGHSYFNIHDIKDVTETGKYFFIMMNQFICIVIPKEKIQEVEELEKLLMVYEENIKFPFIRNLSWQWK
jgi:hypothetical protein